MKRIYIYVVIFLMNITCLMAQEAVNREVTIEKEFTPLVKDASKINVLPEVETPEVKKTSIRYSDWSVPFSPATVLQVLPVSSYDTDYPFSHQRGYVSLGMGNYWNIQGNAGYRILDKEKDQLGIWYQHNSTNGSVRYLSSDDKTKLKQNDNLVNLFYKHSFSKVSFLVDGNYRYNSFNYYGLSNDPVVGSLFPEGVLSGYTKNQVAQQFSMRAGLASSSSKDGVVFAASVGYRYYNNRLGLFYGQRGATENQVETKFSMSAPINERHLIGLKVQMNNLIYQNSVFDNYTMISLNPYYDMNYSRLDIHVGVMADFTFNQGPVIRFAPDVKVDWEFYKSYFLYTTILGGKELNTMANLAKENIYLNPSGRPVDGYTPFDWTVGFRSNAWSDFWFEIYGGFKTSDDVLFDYRLMEASITAPEIYRLSRPIVDNLALNAYCWKAGLTLKYKYGKILESSLNLQRNAWYQSDGGARISYNRPDTELNFEARVNITPRLSVDLNYYWAAGRKYLMKTSVDIQQLIPVQYKTESSGKLKDIHELNLGASYRFNNQLYVSTRFNNILGQHYDLFYGMPAQRFNFMIGAGFNF